MQGSSLKENFINPPEGYGMVPFWFWNDGLEEGHLLFQMKEMKDKGIEEFIIHARLGITVKYLSDRWFDKVRFVVEKAEEMGLKVWIYDEENWPSGYAGGRVLADNPGFCAKYMLMEKLSEIEEIIDIQDKPYHKLEYILAQAADGSLVNLKDSLADGKLKNENYCGIYAFYKGDTLWHPAYSKDYYIDLLNLNATEFFLKHTHYAYKRHLGKYFGKVIKGFFVDEPGFYNNFLFYEDREDRHTIPWTDEFASYFYRRNGYDIADILPFIWEGAGGLAAKARVDYYDTLAHMYKNNFLEPIKRFCEENGMESIGHVHSEEYISYHIRTQGNMMEALSSLSFSGIDRIDANYEKVTEKYGSSAAHIYGHTRTLSETYGGYGWSLTLEKMKEIANWQYVRGINLLTPHAFYSSIEGNRKWECPPSEFYQATFWPYFGEFSEYIKRLSYLLSQGKHVCHVAIYYPVASCQAVITPYRTTDVDNYDRFFIDMSNSMLESQYDFDYITDMVLESADIHRGSLLARQEEYRAVIIPSIDYIPFATLAKLEKFAEDGGIIIVVGNIDIRCIEPDKQEMADSIRSRILRKENVCVINRYNINKSYTFKFDGGKIAGILEGKGVKDFRLLDKDIHIKYLHRSFEDSDLYFLINESECFRNITFEVGTTGSIEKWDALNGSVIDYYALSANAGSMVIGTGIQPYGSAIFVIKPGLPAVYRHDGGLVYKGRNTWMVTSDGIYHINDGGRDSMMKVSDVPASLSLGGLWKISINGSSFEKPLGSWTDWGYQGYSGQAGYFKEFTIDLRQGAGYILNLGKVCNCAEVKINGKAAGSGLWTPYEFDITPLLANGRNTIEIKVTNTLANEFEGKPLPSGLVGPVTIRGYKAFTL